MLNVINSFPVISPSHCVRVLRAPARPVELWYCWWLVCAFSICESHLFCSCLRPFRPLR